MAKVDAPGVAPPTNQRGLLSLTRRRQVGIHTPSFQARCDSSTAGNYVFIEQPSFDPSALARSGVWRGLRFLKRTVGPFLERYTGIKPTRDSVKGLIRRFSPFDKTWLRTTELSSDGLAAQRSRYWPPTAPQLTLLIPVHSKYDIRRVTRVLQRQTYSRWEALLIADEGQVANLCKALPAHESRLRLQAVPVSKSLESGFEVARSSAVGQFIGVMDPADTLAPNCLAEFAEAIIRQPDTDLLYCDEDCITRFGRRHGLRLKPQWSPEMLYGFNYVGRLCLFRRELLQLIGGFAERFGDAQEYDAILRAGQQTQRIQRVPLCLYHRRAPRTNKIDFTNVNGNESSRALALREHFARLGHNATVETLPTGMHRVSWPTSNPPLVSIIIPTLNQFDVLKQCVEDLQCRTDYPRKEIILVDNGSTDANVLAYYRELTASDAVTLVPYRCTFNYSEACNLGARHARGDLLLFLNNDISVRKTDWLMDLVRFALLPGVGCVGTQLHYPDNVIQHGGVVVGVHLCGLLYNNVKPGHWDMFGSPEMYRNALAIMGACQMIPRAAFNEVGGFDEQFRIANSDVALCLRLFRAGYRTVYTPHAALFHHEGYTRGKTNPTEDIELTAVNIIEMEIDEDPYFHPALSAHHSRPKLRMADEMSQRDYLRRQVAYLARIPLQSQRLDPFNDVEIRKFLGPLAEQFEFPDWSPTMAAFDDLSAARLILYVIRSSADLRHRFPRALSDGTEGSFCKWICEQAVSHWRLAPSAVARIRRALATDRAERVRQIYKSRNDFQAEFPGANLPAMWGSTLCWLIQNGKREYGLCDVDIWWYLLTIAEDPVRELVFEYSLSSAWQARFPDAMTAPGWPAFYRWANARFQLEPADMLEVPSFESPLTPADQLRVLYDHRPKWRSLFPNAYREPAVLLRLVHWLEEEGADELAGVATVWIDSVKTDLRRHQSRSGLNVIGHFSYPSGLQASVESVVEALRRQQIRTTCYDVPVPPMIDPEYRGQGIVNELDDVTLIHVQPEPFVDIVYYQGRILRGHDRYRIGMWYWEFGEIPPQWIKLARAVNELWAPTHFIADALTNANIAVPVLPMLPGIEIGNVEPLPRSRFGIPEEKTLFLFAYDMNSIHERKNPLGVIEAFQKAFRPDDRRI